MKIRWQEIKSRLAGFSLPDFNWEYSTTEKDYVRDLIIELEDKRVLYAEAALESIGGTIHSINELRTTLKTFLKTVGNGTHELVITANDMQRACRKYLNSVEIINTDDTKYIFFHNLSFHDQERVGLALGELRTIFGLHVGKLSVIYEIDIEEELASIIPMNNLND
ncbi:DUF6650 family protein [Ekhidna sp.]